MNPPGPLNDLLRFAQAPDFSTMAAAAIVVLLLLLWLAVRNRAARRRAEAREREERALQALSLLRDSRMAPPKIDEAIEVFDLDAVLAGDPAPVADAARAQLEAPTNLPSDWHDAGTDADDSMSTGIPVLNTSARLGDVHLEPASAELIRALSATVQPRRANETQRREPNAPAAAVPAAPVVPAATAAPAAAPPRASTPAAAPLASPGGSAQRAESIGGLVPLRDLVVVWFEARGYRVNPASEAVRPIELVLRHRDDPARAYAFVPVAHRMTMQHAEELLVQAQGIGLPRVVVAADGGTDPDIVRAARKRGVRIMDRGAMSSALSELDFRVAAKIVAVARTRATSGRSHSYA